MVLTIINFILNLAGLLLWLGWRDARVDTLVPTSAASLLRTLRRVGPSEWARWKYFIGLVALLAGRAVIYRMIGPSVRWTPALILDPIALLFRSEVFSRMLLFSVLSFAMTLVVFYLALLFLSMVNARVTDAEPLQKFVRRHLQRVDRLPGAFKLCLPFLLAAVGWMVLSPLLARWEVIPGAALGLRFRQGLILGLGLCLTWKHVIAGTLLLYFLNNHVHFGTMQLWSYVTVTARNLLWPFQWLPLRFGRVDFVPLAGAILVYLAARLLEVGVHRQVDGTVSIIVPSLIDLFRLVS